MHSLDELCEFLGFRVGALRVARYSGQTESDLEMAGRLVKGAGDRTPTSLAELIAAVQNLPALNLQAELLSDRSGEEPYELRVRLSPSQGIVWDTGINFVLNGGFTYGGQHDFGAGGGDVEPAQLGPGTWEIVVERTGIGSIGLTVLRQSLGTVFVTQRPVARPTPQPPVAQPPPRPPLVTCQIQVDGENPGFGGITNFIVSGNGMEADEDVDIYENDGLARTTQANSGFYSAKFGILHANPRVDHVFFARGERSKRTSWKAGTGLL